MRRPPRKRLTAWLGLIAMWLIVFAPVVSQLVVSARAQEPVAALCSTTQPAGGGHYASADPLAACGYCDLLASHPAMPSVPPLALTLLVLVAFAAAPVLSTRFTPFGAFPSGRPRAPPAVS
jgi:hypothetical protein